MVDAVELVPHADRDVVMVKLARRALGITPVNLAAEGPAAGEQLTVTGFGRTTTEWVPDRLHSASFTVTSTAGADVGLKGSDQAVVCQGDSRRPRPAPHRRHPGTRRPQQPFLAGRLPGHGPQGDPHRRG